MDTTPPPPKLPCNLRIGQNVRHPTFGYGVIVGAENGKDTKVCVNFGDKGVKWLLLSVAKLEGM